MNYNTSMFEAIKASLNKSSGSPGGSAFKDVLRFEKNNSYLVRLLPNIHNVEDTFMHYFQFGWESKATGQYISAVSPVTIGERCPINELRMKLYRSSNASDKALAQSIRRSEQWMVNAYVVTNPTNPDLEGQVKILRYGKQLDKIIKEAIEGDDADEYGAAVFDLSPSGCNLRVKVETNEGGYPTYVSSRFLKSSEIPGMTKTKMQQAYEAAHNLQDLLQIKSFEELQEMIDIHIFNKTSASVSVPEGVSKSAPVDDEILNEQIPGLEDEPVKPPKTKSKPKQQDLDDIDDDIDSLLEGLDD